MGRDWKQPRWDIYIGVGGLLLPAVAAGEKFLEGFFDFDLFPLVPLALLLLVLQIIYIPCSVILLVRAFIFARRQPRLLWVRGIMALLLVGMVLRFPSPLHAVLYGFKARLSRVVTAEAFQQKTLAIIGGTAEGVAYTNFVDESHETNLIPVCVTKFWSTGPRFAGINKDQKNGAYFRADNGGHFVGYFGVGAGADSFVLSNAPNQEVLCWKPGVYLFWHDE